MIELDFAKGDGLLPVIVQDVDDGAVLMLAYMNELAFKTTLYAKYLTTSSPTMTADALVVVKYFA